MSEHLKAVVKKHAKDIQAYLDKSGVKRVFDLKAVAYESDTSAIYVTDAYTLRMNLRGGPGYDRGLRLDLYNDKFGRVLAHKVIVLREAHDWRTAQTPVLRASLKISAKLV